MGTSLSGLTPATTFDGLLKVGDNDPLTADLKAISTGDGTDTILSLSNSALQVNGEVTIIGAGNTSDTTALLVQNSDGAALLDIDDNGTVNIGLGNGKIVASPGGLVSVPAFAFSHTGAGFATFDNGGVKIIGSGTGATTTSLLVQNSAAAAAFEVKDNLTSYAYGGLYSSITRVNYINTFNNAYSVMQTHQADGSASFYQSVAVGQTTAPTARLHIKGSGNDNTTTSLLVQNSDGLDMLEVDDSGNVGIGDPNPLSATLHISSQSYFNNTTALRIQNSIGNNLFRIKGDGTTDIINNRYIFNQSGVSTGGAIFKGSGTTSATTALLVQDSAGTDLLKVNDAGEIGLGATPTTNARAFIKSAGSTPATNALVIQNSLSTNLFKVQSDGKVYASNLRSTINSSSIELLQDVDFSGGDNYNFNSTTGGFLPPRMTDAERDAIATPAAGLMIYDTTNNQMNYWNGSTWIAF